MGQGFGGGKGAAGPGHASEPASCDAGEPLLAQGLSGAPSSCLLSNFF